MDTLHVAQGEDLSATITLRDETGTAITGVYDGTEPLDLDVWSGGQQAEVTLSTGSVTWGNAPNGLVALAIGRTDTALLAAGLHFLRIWLTDGPARLLAYEARLDVAPSAAAGTAPPTYCGISDLYALAPWLDQAIASTPTLQADLGEQRALARQAIDETIVARVGAILDDQLQRHGPVLEVAAAEITAGVDAGPAWGASVYPDTSRRDQLDAIRAHLAADRLIVDSRCRTIAANLALAYALEPLLGNGPGGTPYQQLAAAYRGRAAVLLRGWTARIDTDADGTADLEIL